MPYLTITTIRYGQFTYLTDLGLEYFLQALSCSEMGFRPFFNNPQFPPGFTSLVLPILFLVQFFGNFFLALGMGHTPKRLIRMGKYCKSMTHRRITVSDTAYQRV